MADEIVKYERGKHPNSRHALMPQWQQGQSGNPKGRPRKQPITMELERTGDSPCPPSIRRFLAKLGIKLRKNATWNEALARALYHGAVTSGDVAVAREITDRLEGKTRIQGEEDDTQDINVVITHVGGDGETAPIPVARALPTRPYTESEDEE